MKEYLKRTGIISIIASILFAVLGIIMLTNPETTIKIVTMVLGVAIVIMGLVKIISYFALKGNLDFFNYELIYGVIALLLGIVILVHSNTFAAIVRIIIGMWIAYSGLVKTTLSLKLKSAGIKSWKFTLILALVSLIAGILIMFTNTASIVVLTAIVMIIYSVTDIIDELIFMKNIDSIK